MEFGNVDPYHPQQSGLTRSNHYSPAPAAVTVKDVAAVIWRRLWLIILVVAASTGVAFYISKHTPPRWRATAQLLLVQRAAGSGSSSSPGTSGYSAPLVETPDTQVELLQSYSMAQRTLDRMKNDAIAKGENPDSVATSIEDLHKNSAATLGKDSSLITVTLEAGDPKQAADQLNSMCSAFVDWKKEVAQQNVTDALQQLQQRADKALTAMTTAEAAETAFKQQYQLADVPAQQQALLNRYTAQQTEVTALQQDLASQKAHLQTLGQYLKLADRAIETGTGVRDDSQVLSLQSQLNALQIQRAVAALKYTAAFPGVLPQLDAQIKDIKQRLARGLQNTLNNKKPSLQGQASLASDYEQAQISVQLAAAKLAGAITLDNQLKQQVLALPQTALKYERLARDADLARTLYTSLEASLNSARLDKDMAGGNVEIAQYAYVPEKPFTPNRLRDVLVGAAIGLGISFLGLLLLEQSDHRVRNLAGVTRIASGPVVGVLPQLTRSQMRMLADGESPPEIVEGYNLVRARLSLALHAATKTDVWKGHVIMVTSSVPGEGKSVTAAELARSMARAGKSVILVDADMRRPTQNLLFGIDEPLGLADVLTGQLHLDTALVESQTPNLTILPSGFPGEDPSGLLTGDEMKRLVADLRDEADVIIIDTPACAVVADALLIAPYADCILHVIGAGQVDEEMVRDTITALNSAATKMLAFFVNRAPRDVSHSYKSSYTYTRTKISAASRVDASRPGPTASTAAPRVVRDDSDYEL